MISLAKIALTVVVIYLVWYFFKYRARMTTAHKTTSAERARTTAQAAARAPGTPLTQDLVACPKCGSYVAAGTVCSCQKV